MCELHSFHQSFFANDEAVAGVSGLKQVVFFEDFAATTLRI